MTLDDFIAATDGKATPTAALFAMIEAQRFALSHLLIQLDRAGAVDAQKFSEKLQAAVTPGSKAPQDLALQMFAGTIKLLADQEDARVSGGPVR